MSRSGRSPTERKRRLFYGWIVLGANLHLFAYLGDKGLSPATAASVVTCLYVLQGVSKPLWGFVSEVRFLPPPPPRRGRLGEAVPRAHRAPTLRRADGVRRSFFADGVCPAV